MATLERMNTSYSSRSRPSKSWGGKFRQLWSGKSSSKKDKAPVNLLGDFGDDTPVLRRRNTTMGMTGAQQRNFISIGNANSRVNHDMNHMNHGSPVSPTIAVKTISAEEFCSSPKNAICELCEGNRLKIARVQREIEKMRDLIINDPIVALAPPEGEVVSPEIAELVDESVKLRITIDSLMRFQSFEIADSR